MLHGFARRLEASHVVLIRLFSQAARSYAKTCCHHLEGRKAGLVLAAVENSASYHEAGIRKAHCPGIVPRVAKHICHSRRSRLGLLMRENMRHAVRLRCC